MSEGVQDSNLTAVRPRRTRTGLGLRVLVVEDDEQVASILVALLEVEGYDVTAAATAEGGLTQLREHQFHLLVSDYWLPDKTGAWMLAEAARENVLGDCKVLVVTAEHRPQGVENLRVLRKPLDLDDFLRVVHDELAPVRERELERNREEVQQLRRGGSDGAKLQLTLYVSSSSPSSLRAMRNLRRILDEYDASQVKVTVCDLSREVSASADEDRIAFTPTLVKRGPEPRLWILGDLQNAEVLTDLLTQCGVERSR